MRTPPVVLPALVTPFDADGAIDVDAHRYNLATLAERGVAGFLIGGSTGEGPYLEPGERERLVAAARAELGDDPFLIGGVAAESVRLARWQVHEVAEGGADAVLVLTPTTLVRGKDREVAEFYRTVAEASPLPVFLYTVPSVTGYELPVETAVQLAAHPNVNGIKDSGGHPVRIQQTVQGAPGDFFVFNGSSAAVSVSVGAGAHGAITASANYASGLVAEVVAAATRSIAKAAEAQDRLNGITRLVESRGIPGVKLAAEVAGLRPGSSRLPLGRLDGEVEEKLRRSLGVLKHQILG